MTRFAAFAIAAAAASPALAHSGAHLHPHDAAGWLTVVLGLALICAASGLIVARQKTRARR